MQKQTNPEPLGAPTAKLILAVAIIVYLGALFGAIGYLAMNKPAKIQQPQVSVEKNKNLVAEYLKNCEWQYETEQEENIKAALNDILNLSEEQLKEKRNRNYVDKENQWDLPMLIYRHCVWGEGKTLGGNFFQDVKKKEAQEEVKQIIEKYFEKGETADWKTYRNEEYGFEIKYPKEVITSISSDFFHFQINDYSEVYILIDEERLIFGNRSKNSNNEIVTIDNHKAIKFNKGIGEYGLYGYFNRIDILGDKFVYQISYRYNTDKAITQEQSPESMEQYIEKDEKIFLEMVSTFHFIE